ncbi:hypothetical protein H5410_041372 [Solanum commersonii]|uniref:Uncharacterized protein n=1 Tax=Solanum commersonii TaxID=4109 RepID=A0A9J5XSV9_SOLCO|nr:hypothetical protein H5410_041372 [Solanum commersonii]
MESDMLNDNNASLSKGKAIVFSSGVLAEELNNEASNEVDDAPKSVVSGEAKKSNVGVVPPSVCPDLKFPLSMGSMRITLDLGGRPNHRVHYPERNQRWVVIATKVENPQTTRHKPPQVIGRVKTRLIPCSSPPPRLRIKRLWVLGLQSIHWCRKCN